MSTFSTSVSVASEPNMLSPFFVDISFFSMRCFLGFSWFPSHSGKQMAAPVIRRGAGFLVTSAKHRCTNFTTAPFSIGLQTCHEMKTLLVLS
jgi:hypothetical protein